MRQDDAPVLGPAVRSLPIDLRRVVHRPEHLEELVVRDDVRVEGHLDDLGVAGGAGADEPVVGVLDEAPAIARDGLDHARDLPEDVLDAPEAAGAEGGELGGHVVPSSDDRSITIVSAAWRTVSRPPGRSAGDIPQTS